MTERTPPSFEDIERAAARIGSQVRRTPVMTSRTLDRMSKASLFFKCEHLQRTGAFKFRGATNTVMALGREQAVRGVATHSSGNHGAALACAAAARGIPCTVVMPKNSSAAKVHAVREYGAEIVFCEPNDASRRRTLREVVAKTNQIFVHPFEEPLVIAGQGTIGLELLDQVPDLDCIVVPVGGGGMISGIALAAHHKRPSVEVHAAEPKNADDTFRSMQTGSRQSVGPEYTIADGLRTSVGELAFDVIKQHVASVTRVSEDQIITAMRTVYERMKQVIEPSAAVGVAAVLNSVERFEGKRVGVVLCGGNVDLARLPWMNSTPPRSS